MMVATLQQQIKINSDARFTKIRKSNDKEIEFQFQYFIDTQETVRSVSEFFI